VSQDQVRNKHKRVEPYSWRQGHYKIIKEGKNLFKSKHQTAKQRNNEMAKWRNSEIAKAKEI